MKIFWKKLKRPFFCLAPMSDVTDAAFRKIVAKYGKPHVMWTEFVSADGLCNPAGRKKLAHILKFSKEEKPIVAQVFGANPAKMTKACEMISRLGFSGIDINMGCPERGIVKQGAGSALIKNPELAREIIRSAIAGAHGLPVSVKTRVGFSKEEIDTWIPEILKENISALTIHARTRKEMSKVPARWAYVKKVVALVKKSGKKIPVIGNGDIKNIKEGKIKAKKAGCDGVMIGRGAFGKPWIFSGRDSKSISLTEKLAAIQEHIKIFDKELLNPSDGGKGQPYDLMKKHFKAYVNGFAGAKELRNKLMLTKKPAESLKILTDFQKTLK